MEKRKAIATAAAITMSLTSGVIAVGANFGSVGFGASRGAAATHSVVAVVAATPASGANSARRAGDDGIRTETPSAARSASTKGESNG